MKVKGFTLIELMVVILIVGILAAASVPMMRGRIDSAKWSEANATAGTIKSAARVYFAEHGAIPTGAMGTTNQNLLGFTAPDLTGTYFGPSNYTIGDTGANDGTCSVSVTSDGSGNKPAAGTYKLDTTGSWTKQGS